MTIKKKAYWIRDCIWPLLEPLSGVPNPPKAEWADPDSTETDALETAYSFLRDEYKAEFERVRMVESKLQSISSLSPIAITIVAAIVAFLTGGKLDQFTRTSTLFVEIGGFFIAFQFVRAMLAATEGLERKGYYFTSLRDIPPKIDEKKGEYIRRLCEDLAANLRNNREVTNGKVNQLALGHRTIKNAVFGLLVLILVLVLITIFGQQP